MTNGDDGEVLLIHCLELEGEKIYSVNVLSYLVLIGVAEVER